MAKRHHNASRLDTLFDRGGAAVVRLAVLARIDGFLEQYRIASALDFLFKTTDQALGQSTARPALALNRESACRTHGHEGRYLALAAYEVFGRPVVRDRQRAFGHLEREFQSQVGLRGRRQRPIGVIARDHVG